MRHAKSGWDTEGVQDHDRPLNDRGQRAAPSMGQLIVDKGLVPELILSSTALRARETALAVAAACAWKPEVRLTRSLYMAEPGDILEVVSQLSDDVERVLVVGHNPGMEDLVSDLSLMRNTMPTAALAKFELSIESWSHGIDGQVARLVDVWRPREIGD
jgi:phosphohistidine phosphatase